jgi:REP element-mobilizing transposase RayT
MDMASTNVIALGARGARGARNPATARDTKRTRSQQPEQLGLSARGRRGGYRARAGRPGGRSKHYVAHVPRAHVDRRCGVHVTMRVVEGVPSLRRPPVRALIERVFAAEKRRKGFRLTGYSIRSNHMHLVCEADETRALSRGVQRLASRIARGFNARYGRSGRLFADRFHGRVFNEPKDARRVLRYVLCNEHKDRARAGVAVRGVDPYSSGAHFDGWHPSVARPTACGPPAVTTPESWLLRVGWRNHGLIRTDEYPLAPPAWLDS